MLTGKVRYFDDSSTKGFGFIEGSEGDIFAHINDVRASGLDTLVGGQYVSYEVGLDRKNRPTAINIKVIEDLGHEATHAVPHHASSGPMRGRLLPENFDSSRGRGDILPVRGDRVTVFLDTLCTAGLYPIDRDGVTVLFEHGVHRGRPAAVNIARVE